jgi:hypothetical protein
MNASAEGGFRPMPLGGKHSRPPSPRVKFRFPFFGEGEAEGIAGIVALVIIIIIVAVVVAVFAYLRWWPSRPWP